MASHIYYPKKPTTKMIVPFIRQEVIKGVKINTPKVVGMGNNPGMVI